jgi:hypothetical protein
MVVDTLERDLDVAWLEPRMGWSPSARVEEGDEGDHDFDAEPEEPSRFDDPDQPDVSQDLDDEDLEDDDGWADEDEDY